MAHEDVAAAARGPLVVAIDGPAGSGKSTVARAVARRLGWRYVDTGAIYRSATVAVLERGVEPTDPSAVAEIVRELDIQVGVDPEAPRVEVDGQDVTDRIRSPEVTAAVSAVSAVPAVRQHLLRLQRDVARGGPAVVEGRDIGTTVFPSAPVKIFLTAAPGVRAGRRAEEMKAASLETAAAALARRDALDSARRVSPLACAADALVIDSTDLDVEEVVGRVLEEVRRAGLTAAPAEGP